MFFELAVLACAGVAAAQNSSTSVSLQVSSSGGNATSGMQYGIMFEDINHSGDGGIYAELIQNRAFQGASSVDPFTAVGGATLSLQNLSTPLSSALPQSMNVAVSGANGTAGFANPGWWGIDIQPETYTGSFYVYGAYSGAFKASLVSTLSGEVYASANVTSHSVSGKWTQHNYTLVPEVAAPNVNNSLQITFDSSAVNGSLNFDLISLFPPTYNNRPNGQRIDLMEALKGLAPSFLRLPGGNNLEGDGEESPRWIWNETIGPLTDRPGRLGTWGYWNTDGLGLVEYMWWCIDLGMEPILAVWAGFYLDGPVIPEDEIDIYVQDALNELEFLMGDPSTEYGALRVSLGYGEDPIYNIKYVEVGNEDNLGGGGSSYEEYRFNAFQSAINSAYPNITVIASTVAYPETLANHSGGDYHQYTRPDMFVSQFDFFDQNTSSNPILVGEYATVEPNSATESGVNWTEPRPTFPFWIGSVAEAIFLIGTERNSDAILGASYAPLLQNLNSYEWVPDLIAFTADTSVDVLSTSYHVIELFSNTRIAETLPVTTDADFGPAYWVAGSAASAGSYVLKAAVYNTTADVSFSVSFPDTQSGASANLTVLTAPGPYSSNTPGSDVVSTNSSTVTATGNGTFSFALPEWSVALLAVD